MQYRRKNKICASSASKGLLLLASLVAILLPGPVCGEDLEIYFKFRISSRDELEQLSRIISVDDFRDNVVYAYANSREWQNFLALGYDYTVLPHPGTLIVPKMAPSADAMAEWDEYPTYDTYVSMMSQYAADYPGLCTIVNTGSTVEGRSILYARISDNVNVEEDEPEVMYAGSLHGDETTGYVLMLRLIDSLLVGYGGDSLVTRLVDNCEIWINPLANPDGTYRGGNNTVSGAVRKNANGVDLNRNFPDPEDGEHPDGNEWQPETMAMMNLAEARRFVISANFHGGAEVVNYPWDTWERKHADDSWYIDISRAYADSAQYYSPLGYMTHSSNGITNGYDWYTISGGRQDYMNWWHGCREVTIEISDTKLLPADQLPAYWNYNRVSFFNYFENSLYGIRGVVTDSATGLPVSATITIIDHDFDHSQIHTDPDVGDYHRMIGACIYELEFCAPGYFPRSAYPVFVGSNEATRVDMKMLPLPESPILEALEHSAGEADPGDTVFMKITLQNNGGCEANNLTCELLASDTFITIIQPDSPFPNLSAEGGIGTSIDDFEFLISPECPCLKEIEFWLNATADGGFSDSVRLDFLVGSKALLYSDDFSSNLGWTGIDGPGEWTIGPAGGGGGTDSYGNSDPMYDNTPSEDNNILGNDLTMWTGGDYEGSLYSTFWVTSPAIDCSECTDVVMTYYHWLGVEDNSSDHAYLQVYNDHEWTTIFENGPMTIDEASWQMTSYDLSIYADGNPNFRMRFGIGPTNSYANFCGWNVDDIEIRGYNHGAPVSPEMSYQPAFISDSLQPMEWRIDTIKVHNLGEVPLSIQFTTPVSWLIFDSCLQHIYPGDSVIQRVLIHPFDLMPGEHIGSIVITSNDPDFPAVTLPIQLFIFPPEVYLSQTSIQELLSVDQQSSRLFTITNNGLGLLIYDIDYFTLSKDASSWLSVSPISGTVQSLDTDTISVLFDATELKYGTYYGLMTISSNDPVSTIVDVSVAMEVSPGFVCGDADGSKMINLLDVTYLINYLYKNGPAPDPEEAADADGSGTLNLLDATHLINYLYKNGPDPVC
ncbi:MAG: hypothetical protein JSU69_10985 [Candidatus Zixiibacteriota bacterium]|nr:MAG: hypothetical protein JSU69_10985 [candidate division Zixibacteria bacterium]